MRPVLVRASAARSTPCSRARRRANGEARTRGGPDARAGAGAVAAATGAGASVGAAGLAGGGGTEALGGGGVGTTFDDAGLAAGAVPPDSVISASLAPTATSAPSPARTAPSTPSTGDSTSIAALSVSSSTSGSPDLILSPGCFSQRSTLASSMVALSLGTRKSICPCPVKPATSRWRRYVPARGSRRPRAAGCRAQGNRAASPLPAERRGSRRRRL